MASLVSAVMPSSGNWSSLARSQLEVLQSLVKKHLEDPSLTDIASADDFSVTSTERGIPSETQWFFEYIQHLGAKLGHDEPRRYEHSHLVAALDVILEYQRRSEAVSKGAENRKPWPESTHGTIFARCCLSRAVPALDLSCAECS
eukprot:s8_g35.t1